MPCSTQIRDDDCAWRAFRQFSISASVASLRGFLGEEDLARVSDGECKRSGPGQGGLCLPCRRRPPFRENNSTTVPDGAGGLLPGMIKQAVEAAMGAEMTDHLGYDRYAVEGRGIVMASSTT